MHKGALAASTLPAMYGMYADYHEYLKKAGWLGKEILLKKEYDRIVKRMNDKHEAAPRARGWTAQYLSLP